MSNNPGQRKGSMQANAKDGFWNQKKPMRKVEDMREALAIWQI